MEEDEGESEGGTEEKDRKTDMHASTRPSSCDPRWLACDHLGTKVDVVKSTSLQNRSPVLRHGVFLSLIL